GYDVVQAAVPESIFSIDPDENFFTKCPSTDKFSALAAGPGIGKENLTLKALEHLIKNSKKPLLLDADALNIISENQYLIELLPENTIITPHPGEFDRLSGPSGNGYERNQKQITLSVKHRIIIALKGAYTSITMPDGKCYYNSTGNPGMATAGSGDVLTGMILSLLAQGYKPEEATLAGVFLHGLAGDIASARQSQEAMIASDIIENIGNAFNKIQKNEKSVI
ncbi:MAG TPA: NAD(P)H-hydrate dehydratase, partial [Bacteroidales bacterium]|nr:NAD(P)H-hydrate dehydratase [Bacteroidales bacterium]